MVELPDFEALERYVAGRDADVFVSYSANTPRKDEPCRLPHIAVAAVEDARRVPGTFRVGEWRRSWSDHEYAAAVEEVRAAIARGDVYQVNLVQHLRAPFAGDPAGLAQALAQLRPLEPAVLEGDGWAVVSASPELFLARRDGRLWTMPIKGTRPLGVDVDDEKDAAEHVMIVDLELGTRFLRHVAEAVCG